MNLKGYNPKNIEKVRIWIFWRLSWTSQQSNNRKQNKL